MNRRAEQQQLGDLENKITEENLTGEARKQQAIEDTTNAQIAQFTKLAQELGMSQQLQDQWIAKIKSGAQVQDQAASDAAQHIKDIQQLETSAETGFASGFASAFEEFATGTKTAEQAFGQFAVQFMEQVAQMILQMLVLRAITGVAGAFSGGGGSSSVGGDAGIFDLAANGGVFAPRMMADGGFAGMVSSATYFPRFNVVAGEAGGEMMAALARPTFRSLGGIDAIVGNAGTNRLAIANADDLANRGHAGGTIHIQIDHTPETQATIVQNSIKGAVTEVTKQMKRNSPLSSATKALTA